MRYMKILFFILATSLLLSSCKKAKFEGDDCNFDCHILSGKVYEQGTSNLIENAKIVITAKKKKTTKYIVSTETDENGFWKVSFDADYIDNLKEGYIEIERKNFFEKKQRVYFDIDSIDHEQHYTSELFKTAQVFYQVEIDNQNIQRIESRFVFENQGYKELKYTNKEVPAILSFEQTIPANQDIHLSIWANLEENDSKGKDWLKVPGIPDKVNIAPYAKDTIFIKFK